MWRSVARVGNAVEQWGWRGRQMMALRSWSASASAAADGDAKAAKRERMQRIKDLRELSRAPVADCVRALEAEGVEGDVQSAFDWLRKQGLIALSRKADRSASEGVLAAWCGPLTTAIGDSAASGATRCGVMVEAFCETDFAADDPQFRAFLMRATHAVWEMGMRADATNAGPRGTCGDIDVEQVLQHKNPSLSALTLHEQLGELASSMRENIGLRVARFVSVPAHGMLQSYAHATKRIVLPQDAVMVPEHMDESNLGRRGSILGLCSSDVVAWNSLSDDARSTLDNVARQLCMHIVATQPAFLDAATSVPDHIRSREQEVALASLNEKQLAKPEIADRIVSGKLRKLFEESSLLQQAHALEDDNATVADVLARVATSIGLPDLQVVGFDRLVVGQTERADDSDGNGADAAGAA